MLLAFVDLTVQWKRRIINKSADEDYKIIIKVVGIGLFGVLFYLRNEREGANQGETHARVVERLQRGKRVFSETGKRIHAAVAIMLEEITRPSHV